MREKLHTTKGDSHAPQATVSTHLPTPKTFVTLSCSPFVQCTSKGMVGGKGNSQASGGPWNVQ